MRLTKLQGVRNARGLSTTALAGKVGVSVKTIERWETGREVDIGAGRLQALKGALGLTRDEEIAEVDANAAGDLLNRWRAITKLPKPIPLPAESTAETVIENWGAGELTPEALEAWMQRWWARQSDDASDQNIGRVRVQQPGSGQSKRSGGTRRRRAG